MKTIYLVRHAKSDWSSPDQRDFDRVLNERGKSDAPRMAQFLKEKKVEVDLMICSPAARTLATTKILAAGLSYPENNIVTDKRIYLAEDDQLLKVLRQSGDKNAVMLVGHNPGLTTSANSLLGLVIANIPTCGVVAGKLDINDWLELDWNCGDQIFFESPKSIH